MELIYISGHLPSTEVCKEYIRKGLP